MFCHAWRLAKVHCPRASAPTLPSAKVHCPRASICPRASTPEPLPPPELRCYPRASLLPSSLAAKLCGSSQASWSIEARSRFSFPSKGPMPACLACAEFFQLEHNANLRPSPPLAADGGERMGGTCPASGLSGLTACTLRVQGVLSKRCSLLAQGP